MGVLYIRNEAYSFPDSYREWNITIERDVANMALRITSTATDTTDQRHVVESTIDEFHFIQLSDEARQFFQYAIRDHLQRIDNHSQNLALQGITLGPRYASGGSVRNPSPRLIGEQGAPYIGIDRASGPDSTIIHPMSLDSWDASHVTDISRMLRAQTTPVSSLSPSQYEKPTEKPKRKRLAPKPPSEVSAQLSVKPKPRKLRL